MKEIKRELISSSNKTILCSNIIYNKEIQKVKKYLLNELLEGNIENSKEELIEKVKEYILKN